MNLDSQRLRSVQVARLPRSRNSVDRWGLGTQRLRSVHRWGLGTGKILPNT
nr:hypothetical protein [Nostoc sp. DedQUE02]